MHGKAPLLAILMITASLGSVASVVGEAEDVHDPIEIVGDDALVNNTCECLLDPTASGNSSDPFIIEGWRISNPGGPAIEIRNIEENHFIVRDNTLNADTGVELENTGDRGSVIRNTIHYGKSGVDLVNSGTYVADNTIEDSDGVNWWGTRAGVRVDGAAPTIDGNLVRGGEVGIVARGSSPTIDRNRIFASEEKAVLLTESTSARLEDNVVKLAEGWGLVVERSAEADLIDNVINEGYGGVVVDDATLYMVGNEVTNQRKEAVRFQNSVVTMLRNNVSANWRGAFGSTDSDLTMVGNTFEHNENAAIRVKRSEGTIEDNLVLDNGAGIRLDDSRIALEDNVVNNNTLGLSIPYNSRGSIPLMQGNTVNGLNVDGTVHPDEQRIFHGEYHVDLRDENFDSNQQAGYEGTLMAQGALVVYDSTNVTVADSRFAFQHRGMTIHNGSLVRVEGNVFANFETHAVLSIDSKTFFKENECEIDIDPPDRVCFEARGGSARVRLNTILNATIGVKFDLYKGESPVGVIADNQINHSSEAGIHVRGDARQHEHEVTIENNVLARANVIGMVLVDWHADVQNNTVVDSAWAGVHLEGETNATFEGNVLVGNSRGIVDVGECHDSYNDECSGGTFVDNEVRGHAEVGVELDGGGSFDGDVIVDNGVGVDVEDDSHMNNVTVSANAKAGVRARGHLGLEDANVSANDGAGVEVRGVLRVEDTNASENEGDGVNVRGYARMEAVVALHNENDGADVTGNAVVEGGNFSLNERAGLRFNGRLFVVEDCEASFNGEDGVRVSAGLDVSVGPEIDVNPPPLPDVDVPDTGDGDDQDPLFIHHCDVVANGEFALRASQETIVNATANFWGPDGPTYDVPVVPTGNVISNHVLLVSPYWKTRAHEEFGFVPTTELGPDEQVT